MVELVSAKTHIVIVLAYAKMHTYRGFCFSQIATSAAPESSPICTSATEYTSNPHATTPSVDRKCCYPIFVYLLFPTNTGIFGRTLVCSVLYRNTSPHACHTEKLGCLLWKHIPQGLILSFLLLLPVIFLLLSTHSLCVQRLVDEEFIL